MVIRKTDNSPAYFFSITYMCFFVKWEFLSPTGQRMPDENGRKEYGKKPDSGGDSFLYCCHPFMTAV